MELLNNLINLYGPSGNENDVRAFIKEYAENLGYSTGTDAMGNLAAHKNDANGKKIMIAAHMDEIGVIATYIDEKGFVRFSAVGGLEVKKLVHRRVIFKNGTVGVIGCEEEAFDEKAKLSKLFIDIGAADRDEAQKSVSIGDMAVFEGQTHINGDIIISKTLDNRAGCYVLLKAMEKIKTDKDLYFVFTTQEEVGLRGARTAAYAHDFDYAIAVDVTDTGDTPSAPAMAVKLGGGAAIKVMDRSILCDADVREAMLQAAKDGNIPYQLEIMNDGGTDAGAIHTSRSGVKTGGISVPTRYIHSPSEMASIADINSCIDLLCKTIEIL